MKTASNPNSFACSKSRIATLLSAALIAGCLTGCSTLSEAIKESQAKAKAAKAGEEKTVVVAAKPAEAALPNIPADVERCLLAKPKPDGATADAKVTALWAADKAKVKCAQTLFKWYRARQAQAAAQPDGHPKTATKGRPAATWE